MALQSLPKEDGVIIFPALSKEVSVVCDDRGVPFIKASTEADLYRAQGYWAASRRLFQMDMLRRAARGELSEVFGKQTLASDKLMRQIGIARGVAEEVKLLSPEVKKSLEAYAMGVNEYISQADGFGRPLELVFLGYVPRPWEPTDSVVVMKYLQYLAEESWSIDELRQRILDGSGADVASKLFEAQLGKPGDSIVVPEKSKPGESGTAGARKKPAVSTSWTGASQLSGLRAISEVNLPEPIRGLVRFLPRYGSNAWAVSGAASDSGGALLALDRHSGFSDPNLWYACVLSTGEMKVGGVTIPGVPGVLYGRNEKIAWGATALKADTQDLFIEEFSRQFPNKYKTVDGWATAREIEEFVRYKANFKDSEEQLKVMVTRHGPVLLSSENNAVVLSWSGNDITTPSLETYYRLNRADSWQKFRDALRDYKGTPQAFVFADKSGNSGTQIAGNIPERKKSELTGSFSGSLLLPGWTGKCDWTGRMEFEKMPERFNTDNGFVVAGFDSLPDYKSWVSPYPVLRQQAVLGSFKSSGRRAGMPEMADLQGDELAPMAKLVRDTIRTAIEKQEVNDELQLSALKLLDSWDGYLRRQSASASVYESFIKTVGRRVLISKLGPALAEEYMKKWPRWTVLVESVLTEKSEAWLPSESRTFDSFIVTSLSQALKELRLEGGSDSLKTLYWGNLHKLDAKQIIFEGLSSRGTFGKLVDPPSRGLGGDGDTVNTLTVDTRVGHFNCSFGPTQRMLIDMSDDDKFFETQPLGQSGHLMSANRTDQMDAWVNNQPLTVAFSDKQAEKQQRHKVIYSPKSLE